MPDLPPGLYEDLLTSALESQTQAVLDRVMESPLDRVEAPDHLALHVTRLVEWQSGRYPLGSGLRQGPRSCA